MTLSYAQANQLLNTLLARHRHPTATTAEQILYRERQLLQGVGNPHERYPTIHITGTKGKGSTAAMLASALQAAGYRVGLYTSPHLHDVRERVMINGVQIAEDDFAWHMSRLQTSLQALGEVRWFEVITALAFDYFAAQHVDIAVIEAGMGGRRDATTVITPILSILTSLSFDHTHLFGRSLEAIAEEKAGIIKTEVPVVSAPQPEIVLNVFQRVAANLAAPLTIIGADIPYQLASPNLQGQRVRIGNPLHGRILQTNLIGQHQGINAAVAVAAVDQLRANDWQVDDTALRYGLQNVQWPGRFELMPTRPQVILDAAHNPASMAYFMDTLVQLYPAQHLTLVFGASADKNMSAMLGHFLGRAERLMLTQASSGRAASPTTLHSAAEAVGFKSQLLTTADSLQTAFNEAYAATPSRGVVVVTGSVYLVGEARVLLTAKGTITAQNAMADEVQQL
jgi:dihydrofolate synthase / folylpolyglutamate synthase